MIPRLGKGQEAENPIHNGGYRQRDSAEHEEYDGARTGKGYLKTTPSTTN